VRGTQTQKVQLIVRETIDGCVRNILLKCLLGAIEIGWCGVGKVYSTIQHMIYLS